MEEEEEDRIIDATEVKVAMVPKTWGLMVLGGKATPTMPIEWME